MVYLSMMDEGRRHRLSAAAVMDEGLRHRLSAVVMDEHAGRAAVAKRPFATNAHNVRAGLEKINEGNACKCRHFNGDPPRPMARGIDGFRRCYWIFSKTSTPNV